MLFSTIDDLVLDTEFDLGFRIELGAQLEDNWDAVLRVSFLNSESSESAGPTDADALFLVGGLDDITYEVDYLAVDLELGHSIELGSSGNAELRPFVAFRILNLEQELSTDLIGGPTVTEQSIDTFAFGLVGGGDLRFTIANGLNLKIRGAGGVLFQDTDSETDGLIFPPGYNSESTGVIAMLETGIGIEYAFAAGDMKVTLNLGYELVYYYGVGDAPKGFVAANPDANLDGDVGFHGLAAGATLEF